jgi:hypothetical protein
MKISTVNLIVSQSAAPLHIYSEGGLDRIINKV